ncbi:hypothetical protein DVH24_008022 [Malus domestica]|uniref:Uncharacterized protein n=1 Tax=Malus domestica TaxID=3750 RepID=A0A498JPK7_MALDO|nr:hypothetical protein DVH24_008022 [Malus domestica]
MFKFKNGYCKVNIDDVQSIFEIPNRGREAPQSTRDCRIPKPKENKFVDNYFSGMTRIGRREIAQAIQVAFDTGTTERDQDVACLIILYLLNTNLLGSSVEKLPWSLAKNCNFIDNIDQYNSEVDNAKQIEDLIEQRPEDVDDDFVNPPPASKKKKMEKKVAKKGPTAKKAKPSNKLVFHAEEGETVVGPKQVANKDEIVVAPKLLKAASFQTRRAMQTGILLKEFASDATFVSLSRKFTCNNL